jgi:hypothetical protein
MGPSRSAFRGCLPQPPPIEPGEPGLFGHRCAREAYTQTEGRIKADVDTPFLLRVRTEVEMADYDAGFTAFKKVRNGMVPCVLGDLLS